MSARAGGASVFERLDGDIGVGTYNQSLAPYLGRTVTLVAYEDEFAFGLKREPERYLPTINQFERVWRLSHNAIAILPQHFLPTLESRNLPMLEITRNARDVMILRP